MPDPNFIPSNDIPGKLRVPAQVVLDAKLKVASKEVLMDLGEQDNLAYTYYRGLVVKTDDLLEYWEWREPVDITEVGLLPSGYLYPDGLVVDGIDYSNATYNFFPFLQKLPSFAKVVYFNDVDPSIATIFDTVNPPIINDDNLKNDVDNLYVGNNASTWVYKTSPAGYVTYSSTSSGSNFTITGTNTDAGSIKTGSITKKGELVIDSEVNDVSGLKLSKLPSAGTAYSSTLLSSPGFIGGFVFGADGVLYTGHTANSIARRVNLQGVVTTLATLTTYVPSLCKGSDNHLYVLTSQGGDERVYRVTLAGVATIIATGGVLGTMQGIVHANDGNLYITGGSNKIFKVTMAGVITTFATGIPNARQIEQGTDGNLYVTTAFSNTLYKVTLAGVVTVFATGFNGIYGITKGLDGALYVADTGNSLIKRVAYDGSITTYASGISAVYLAFSPSGTLYHTTNSDIFVSLSQANKVLKTDALGKVIRTQFLEDKQYATIFDNSLKEDKFNKGVANGYTPLDNLGKVPLIHIDDSNFVHKTGNETISGVKTFNNTLANLSRIKAVTSIDATSSTLITASQSSTYGGLEVQALGNSSKGLIGLVGACGGDPAAVFLKSNLTGSGASYATMLVLDNITAGNDVTPIRVRKQGVEVAKLDYLGNIKAASFIKTGGLPTQFLKADGSVDTTAYLTSTRTLNINGNILDLSANRSWRVAQADTGVLTYGGISVASTTTVNVGAITGVIVDNETTPGIPTYINVSYAGGTNITVPTIATGTGTYVLLNSSNALVFQNTFPTSAEKKSMIYLSKISHPNLTSISFALDEVDFVTSPLAQFRDVFQAIQYIKEGLVVTGNAGLTISNANGKLTGDGINFVANRAIPNTIDIATANPRNFLLLNQSGAVGSFVTAIDPANYDVGGTTTAIGGGTNRSTIQYLYYAPGVGFAIQRGQTIYNTLSDAIAAVGRESFIVRANLVNNSILVAAICLRHTTTNMNDLNFARVLPSDKFGQISGASAGISIANLQTAYNNSPIPQIGVTDLLGALTVRNARALNTATIQEWQNIAGTTTASIDGNGGFTGTSWNGYTPANDANVIHKTGDESGLTGIKSWTNIGASQTNGLNLINNGTGASASLRVVNTSTGLAQYIDNQNSGNGIYMLNSGTGYGIWLEHSGTGRGIYINGTNTGTGLWINNSSTGRGIYLSNSSSGEGVIIVNGGTGTGITSNSLVASTGFLYTGQNNGTNTFTVNKTGDIVANKYTKTGGLATEYLRADGSVNTTVITGTLSTNRISKSIGVNSITDSQIRDDGTNVGIGGNASVKLEIFGSTKSDAFITNGGDSTHFIDGTGALQNKSQFQLALTNPITGTGVTGQVSFFSGTTTQTGDNGLFWDNTGKRLLLQTSDSRLLGGDSVGRLVVSNSTTTSYIEFDGATHASPNKILLNTSTGIIAFSTNSLERVRVDNNGNVGIGITNPISKFVVLQSANTSFEVGTTATQSSILSYDRVAGVFKQLNFRGLDFIWSTSDVVKMSLNNNGNLGIGIDAPTHKLHVKGNTYETSSIVVERDSGAIGKWSIGVQNLNNQFGIQDLAQGGLTRLVISPTGNVGIGLGSAGGVTTTPTAKLHVVGGSVATNITTALANANLKLDLANPAISIAFGYTNDNSIDTGYIQAGTSSNNPKQLLINPYGGNVCLGNVVPTEKLHVVGNILASGTITPSDKRLKSNIVPIENGLDSVMKMKPISYDKAWELGGEVMSSEYGFLANDLKAIFTGEYIVKTPKQKDDILSVNYTSLIAVLTKAIQEQQIQIQELQAKLS